MIINADLHIHSRYSIATSKNMVPDVIAPQAKLKGLHLVGTGDALHPEWLRIIENITENTDEGIYSVKNKWNNLNEVNNLDTGCKFILTVEVEDFKRVHHLLILPSFDSAYNLRDQLRGNLDTDGRPKVRMSGAEIMDIAHENGCLIGPSHAFTPWTSLYKEYDSIYDCYGQKPDYLELGLSADSDMADQIKELQDIPFLTNSDAHSPWPHRLGREFNSIETKRLSFKDVTDAISKQNIIANYGFDPRMGKYYKTACTKCYKIFEIEEALQRKMKCPCGGTIKKGVDYRIYELSTWNEPHHPIDRPPYIHILPLAEIISLIYNKGVTTAFVQKIWKILIQKFGSEINTLIHAPLREIESLDTNLVPIIKVFRNNTLQIVSGGGGRYGHIVFEDGPDTSLEDDSKVTQNNDSRSANNTLDNYF